MRRIETRRAFAGASLLLALGGCANGGSSLFGDVADSGQSGTGTDDSSANTDAFEAFNLDSGAPLPDVGVPAPPCNGTLSIAPSAAAVTVTVDASGIKTVPVTFTAQCDGRPIAATFNIDRGDLGALGAVTGTFTASGQGAGAATVTASTRNATAAATLTVHLSVVANGAPPGGVTPDAGLGGLGGVGGAPLGGPVPPATVSLLENAVNLDAGISAGTIAWLYPYDNTVWPQGLLPPLLQWTPPPAPASAVYIHLHQADFEFQGFYSGTNLLNQPIDPAAWSAATNGNGGDALRVEVTLTDGTHVYGPIAENWVVAPGRLKGVVYYSSYYTQLAKPIFEDQPAAILAIRTGSTDPVLAIPGSQYQCLVCHEISGNGATLYASNGQTYPNYNETDVFDLRSGSGMPTQTFLAPSPDGTVNDRKFLWSGLWQDGSFALQGSGDPVQETYAWPEGDSAETSRIFRRTDGNALPAPGFDGVIKKAATPAFSPDGTKVVFNFLEAQPGTDAGLTAGNGHTLDLMDVTCGSPVDAGDPPSPTAGPACGTTVFSGLRRLYTNADSTNGWPGWPAWLPDSQAIVFHNTVTAPGDGKAPLSTWYGAQAEIWFVPASTAASPTPPPAVPLYALNGKDGQGRSYLPTGLQHPDDTVLNYEPTVSPIASGGYFWVVFTSRRMYGNVATGKPYDVGNGTYPVNKKLWVAAIDLHPTSGKDPSHPAFYLPAQELNAPNMRGYWVPAPCASDGMSCTTGDECCGGYCEQGPGGALTCGSVKPTCAAEDDRCYASSDCCGARQGYTCINSVCARPSAR